VELFGDKVRMLRVQHGLRQEDLAKAIGVSSRTIQNYELGASLPKKKATIQKLADYFNVPVAMLLGTEDYYVLDDLPRTKVDDAERARVLLNDMTNLFAGGNLSLEDRNLVIRTMTDLYLEACSMPKRRSRRPKKDHD